MATLKQIKQKIGAIRKLGQVTRAMEAVAAAKMRRTQVRAWHLRPYMRTAAMVAASLAREREVMEQYRQAETRDGAVGIVVITADRGLAGALNTNVVRAVQRSLKERSLQPSEVSFFAIGKRGGEFFRNRGWEVVLQQERWGDVVPLSDIRSLARSLLLRWEAGALRSVEVWFSFLKSTFEQRVTRLAVLPLHPESLFEAARQVEEGMEVFKGAAQEPAFSGGAFTFAPSAAEVAASLVPISVTALLAHAVAESAASEQAARMVAMKNATDRGKELVAELTLSFNKARQAAITREISEIVGSIEAMQ